MFHSLGQKPTSEEERETYQKGLDLISAENYGDALKLFLRLDSLYPGNAEYKYETGICYLNGRSNKVAALPYFREVEKRMGFVSADGKQIESEFYFYMGRALHLAYLFDDAVSYYEKYLSLLKKDEKQESETRRQIGISRYAKQMIEKISFNSIVNLGAPVNTPFPEYCPVITADESQMVFTSRKPGSTGGKFTEEGKYFEDIFVSYNINGKWSEPKGIDTAINTSVHEAGVALSVDGDQLIIYKDDNGEGNLYACNLNGNLWTSPNRLNENVNTKYWEPSASLSSDRTILYFVSNRLGENRGRDIFVSTLMPDGTWGVPKNLGPKINTEFEEDAPFIHPDGKTLYFSSTGHNTLGGFDIFRSRLDDYGNWSTPENLGYPINTPDDDVFFVLSANGKHGYFSSDREGGLGGDDIYRVDFIESKQKALVVLKGIISHKGDTASLVNSMITVTDQATGEIIGYFKPNTKTGKFLAVLPPEKNFTVSIQEDTYKPLEDLLVLEMQKEYVEIDKSYVLTPLIEKKEIIPAQKIRTYLPKDSIPALPEKVAINVKVNETEKTRNPEKAATPEKTIDITHALPGDKIILHHIYYDFNRVSILRAESFAELGVIVKLMKENPGLVVEISSHTDSIGSAKYNQKLSHHRAYTVSNYLVSKGISSKRIVPKGYGESRPIAPNSNADGSDNQEGRQKNRRTEFKILGLEGKAEIISGE